jgi:hypothetical protein
VYESRVRDTGAVSTWGRLSWSGRAATLETRSGNTASPDRTWSDWASPGAGGEVTSPPARFIQWRAALGGTAGDDPVLSSVTLPYLQQNFRPEVSSLDVLQPGIALRPQQASTTPAALERSGVSGRVVELIPRPGSRTLVEAGAQALRWTATDQNSGDVLSYALYYRGDREEDWKILASGLGDAYYTIEPNTLPDGMYTVRVVASDAGSNPPDLALTGEFVSRPFAVDSTPPEVTLVPGPVSGSRVRFEAEAADPTSTLKQAEISVDAGPWRPVFPVDGILDGLSEEFVFESGPLGAGEHVIAFRIYDQNDNVGIEKSIVRIP